MARGDARDQLDNENILSAQIGSDRNPEIYPGFWPNLRPLWYVDQSVGRGNRFIWSRCLLKMPPPRTKPPQIHLSSRENFSVDP